MLILVHAFNFPNSKLPSTVKITTDEDSEDDKKIEIQMITNNRSGGCPGDENTSLTLCLRLNFGQDFTFCMSKSQAPD